MREMRSNQAVIDIFKRKSALEAKEDLDNLNEVVPSSGINPFSSPKRKPYRIAKFWDDNFWKVLAVGALFLALTGLIGAFFPPALAVFIPAANFAATHGALGFFAVTALSMIGAGITKFFAGLFCRKTEKKAGRAAERILPDIEREEAKIAQKEKVVQGLDKEILDTNSKIDDLKVKTADNNSKIVTKRARLTLIGDNANTPGSLERIMHLIRRNPQPPMPGGLIAGIVNEDQYLADILRQYKRDNRWRGESSLAFKSLMNTQVQQDVAAAAANNNHPLHRALLAQQTAERAFAAASNAVRRVVRNRDAGQLNALRDRLNDATAIYDTEKVKVEEQAKATYLQLNTIIEPYKTTHQKIYNLLEECVSKDLSVQEKCDKVSQIKTLSESLPTLADDRVNGQFMNSADITAINARFEWSNKPLVKQKDEMVKERSTLRDEIESLQSDNGKHRVEMTSLNTKIINNTDLRNTTEREISLTGLRGVKDNFTKLVRSCAEIIYPINRRLASIF